jgi:hypothetical protein
MKSEIEENESIRDLTLFGSPHARLQLSIGVMHILPIPNSLSS